MDSRQNSPKINGHFVHCKQCLSSLPLDTSPSEYQSIEVSFTGDRVQVWCKRHQCNMVIFYIVPEPEPVCDAKGRSGESHG